MLNPKCSLTGFRPTNSFLHLLEVQQATNFLYRHLCHYMHTLIYVFVCGYMFVGSWISLGSWVFCNTFFLCCHRNIKNNNNIQFSIKKNYFSTKKVADILFIKVHNRKFSQYICPTKLKTTNCKIIDLR